MQLDGYCKQWLKDHERQLPWDGIWNRPQETLDDNFYLDDSGEVGPRPSFVDQCGGDIPDLFKLIAPLNLSPRDIAIMKYLHIDGYYQADVAKCLGVSPSLVSIRNKAVLNKLKKYWN